MEIQVMKGLSRWQQFPWREGNRFQLLVDGTEIYSAMLGAIHSAQSHVLLEMYLVESGTVMEQFITAFLEVVMRGVKVSLLFDAYGTRGLSYYDRHRLEDAGIHIVFYNPLRYGKIRRNLLRDHRKLLIVDGSVAFVGGMGITDDFSEQRHPGLYWHDAAVQVEGPVVADWLAVFQRNWDQWTRNKYPISASQEEFTPFSPGQTGRVAAGRFLGRPEIYRSVIKRMLGAEHHVWMMTAYFVPMHRLLRALRFAASHGVDVRLLVPGPRTDHPAVRYAGRRYFHSLLHAGVRIYEYQPRFLHAKVVLCDGWVSLGSSNIDRWNLNLNLEGNQEVEDSRFTQQIRELFEKTMQECQECRLDDWPSRAWYHRLQEWFWGKVELWLDNLSERLKRRRDGD
jgi:phosphatidylserine/phosphatidylglycerophosphate/cardiolipin synthase-like enzyme